jgi:hypothetical protein
MLDALGCAATAGLIVAAPAALRPVDPSTRSRWPMVAALAVTSATCVYGARSPSPAALRGAALLNSGWVAASLATLTRDRDKVGRTLVVTTAALDAAAGMLQFTLSRKTEWSS